MKPIQLPESDRPMSSLDGYMLIGIDTDPDSQLCQTIAGLHAKVGGGPQEVVAVIPVKFHGRTPGYLVVAYDKKKDPRAEK